MSPTGLRSFLNKLKKKKHTHKKKQTNPKKTDTTAADVGPDPVQTSVNVAFRNSISVRSESDRSECEPR